MRTVRQVSDGGEVSHQVVITGGVGCRQGPDELDIEGVAGGFEQHQVLIPLVGKADSGSSNRGMTIDRFLMSCPNPIQATYKAGGTERPCGGVPEKTLAESVKIRQVADKVTESPPSA
ncbi:MAG TPA: hypothetical protein VFZ06_03025 [Acidimicrobiia bacterium]|nr:hypothetical protein [Acidimicrobiia bacterium]